MAKRKSKPQPKPGSNLGDLLRGELIGSVFVIAAILTWLSLLSTTRGALTGALVEGLAIAFGVGAWLAPGLLGLLGLWLALRGVVASRLLALQRLGGALALFLVFEGVAHLLVGPGDPFELALDGLGGGLVGWVISSGLLFALGLPATVATLLLIALLALLAVAGWSIPQVAAAVAEGWRSLRPSAPGPDGLRVNPPLPLGRPELPWQRWWRRLRALRLPRPAARPEWDEPFEPPRAVRSAPARPAQPAQPAPAAPAPAEVVPRVVGGGGGQVWRVPLLSDMLEDSTDQDIQGEDLRRRAQIIEATLAGFGVPVSVVEANQGPAVTQFGLRPGVIIKHDRNGEKRVKVRVAQIQQLSNDLSLALAASPIRIEAPVPGRDIVGVEVPNVQISMVSLRGVMESEEFTGTKGKLVFGLGRDVSGQGSVADLARMPHLLIAGATGSGKSVCVNAVITALLLTHTPETLRFLMIDPKRVELTVYNGVPHLIAPVVVDVERAVPVLQWATREMERRYKLFAKAQARNVEAYNEKLAAQGEPILPYVVILIDELADLMLSAPEDVERHICRIAQMARATGIHLVIATQRPSVDVVTGLIKANFPARIAFAVTSQIDSRVILDTPGAEQLLGRGDMLFMAPDQSKLQRLQGCFVSDRETTRLVRYWKGARTFGPETGALEPLPLLPGMEGEAPPAPAAFQGPGAAAPAPARGAGGGDPPWLPGQESLLQPTWDDLAQVEQDALSKDDLYAQAVAEVRKSGRASISLLQRRLRIGYSRSARLIDELETNGVVGPDQGASRGREVLPEA